MKRIWISFVLPFLIMEALFAQVSINSDNSTPHASSMLEVKSTSKGILLPRMTATQRNGIGSPANGLLVFVTDDNTFYYFAGGSWIPVFSLAHADADWIISGNDLFSAVSGNVGIGTTTPQQQLELTMSLGLPSTTGTSTGVLYKGGVSFLHDFKASSAGSVGQNIFLGRNAGNFTMPGGNTWLSSDNTGIGTSALHNLTTGYANTAQGSFAMPNNTSGYENTGIGLYAMYASTEGYRNSSLGAYSMKENTSGNHNVVIGFDANRYNQAGSNNTILGSSAGRGTAVHSKSGNIFIGYQAGYFESGSNKLYIENSSSTSPLIGGDFSTDNVGIGTANPSSSAKLEIVSTNKGFLPPRMTSSQRLAIASPAAGLLVFQTDAPAGYYYYTGNDWVGLADQGLVSNCIDYDGNAYPTTRIGTKVWMGENLRVTHYRNGDAIPNVTDNAAWAALTTGAYCWYNNDATYNAKYGAMYNWYAANDPRNICPEGWHVPDAGEWTELATALGGDIYAGGKLKSVSPLWTSPNNDATNSSGFSSLPGGTRFETYFGYLGEYARFWVSGERDASTAYYRSLQNTVGGLGSSYNFKSLGMSVRCVKDY